MKFAPILLLLLAVVLMEIPDAESKKGCGTGCRRQKRTISVLRKQLRKCQKTVTNLRRIIKKPPGSCSKPRLFLNQALMSAKYTSHGCEITYCKGGRPTPRIICTPPTTHKVHWSYSGDTGPANWKNMEGYSQCGYHRQSPIDIKDAVADTNIGSLTFLNYDLRPAKISISNNGHAAALNFELSSTPEMSDGGLPGKFIFHHIHFHWGSTSTQGSEHTVDGTQYPVEMHAVHYNAKYGDIGSAVASGNGDGLAVLGLLFEIDDADNAALEPVITGLADIHAPGAEANVASLFSLQELLVTDLASTASEFYRYNGSLTTPSCNQVVVWTVVAKPIKISENQVAEFRKLKDEHNHDLVDNYRPVQPIFGRQIAKTF